MVHSENNSIAHLNSILNHAKYVLELLKSEQIILENIIFVFRL